MTEQFVNAIEFYTTLNLIRQMGWSIHLDKATTTFIHNETKWQYQSHEPLDLEYRFTGNQLGNMWRKAYESEKMQALEAGSI